jgi:hypothetical protein
MGHNILQDVDNEMEVDLAPYVFRGSLMQSMLKK